MDSERQRIYEALNKIVSQRGAGRKKGGASKRELEELYPDKFKNPYVDDGSLEYDKMVTDITKQIAKYLFGVDNVEAIQSVPQATINKVIKELKAQWQFDADLAREDYEEAAKGEEVYRGEKKKADAKAIISRLEPEGRKAIKQKLHEFSHPEVSRVKRELPALPAPRVPTSRFMNKADILAIGNSGAGRRKPKISAAERKKRSNRMKAMHRQGKL